MKKLKTDMEAFQKAFDSAFEDLKRKVGTLSDSAQFDNQIVNFREVQIKLNALVTEVQAIEEPNEGG